MQETGKLKLFFFDYGTKGFVHLSSCKILMEEFLQRPKLAFRGSLSQIKPKENTRLWDLKATIYFLGLIKEKKLRIKIGRHHDVDDFYEILLSDSDNIINKLLVMTGFADQMGPNETPQQLDSPSFQMLETLSTYPTFGDRFAMLDRYDVDFNYFEEHHIAPITNPLEFESELKKALMNPCFAYVKNAIVIFGL